MKIFKTIGHALLGILRVIWFVLGGLLSLAALAIIGFVCYIMLHVFALAFVGIMGVFFLMAIIISVMKG